MLLRHSSFVAVEHVQVSGVHGPQAPAIEAALDGAARAHEHARRARRRAARRGRAVPASCARSAPIRASRTASGSRSSSSRRSRRCSPAGRAPRWRPTAWCSARRSCQRRCRRSAAGVAPAPGAHLHDRALLGALAVLGAAPPPLGKLVARAYIGPEGLTVAMHNGLLVYFGDATRPHAKWLSLARVLADDKLRGRALRRRAPARTAGGGLRGRARLRESEARRRRNAPASPNRRSRALAAGLAAAAPSEEAARHAAKRRARDRDGRARSTRGEEQSSTESSRIEHGHERRSRLRSARTGRLSTTQPQLEIEVLRASILRQRSRVRRSATIVARLDAVVDRAKIPA